MIITHDIKTQYAGTEDYCSFEVSKLLKEKGFDEPCFSYYKNDKSVHWFEYRMRNSQTLERYIMRPYYCLAMKWLREKHKMHVDIDPSEGTWYPCVIELEDWTSLTGGELTSQNTYEEAVEAALKYALESLI